MLFADQPADGVSTLATLGLSRHVLQLPRERQVRQELLIAAESDADLDVVAAALLTLSESLVREHRALLRGEVLKLAKPIGGMAAVYATIPTAFPDALATFGGSDPQTVVVWLIPVRDSEAAFVGLRGWSAFEDALESSDVDLFDFEREPISLP